MQDLEKINCGQPSASPDVLSDWRIIRSHNNSEVETIIPSEVEPRSYQLISVTMFSMGTIRSVTIVNIYLEKKEKNVFLVAVSNNVSFFV